MSTALYTIGYQGISINDFVNNLRENNIYLLVDIREKPWSNRRDFIKSILTSHLESAGIGYHHMKSAGNPSIIRKSTTDIDECLKQYEIYLNQNKDCITEIIDLVYNPEGNNICLLCYENNPKECHRSIIIKKIAEKDNSIAIKHLNSDVCEC